ncbi:hypothetical protein ZIOFF_014819 [Zingiber officinale]|uniref:Uncharacterized protein n=1 Tax=Zingiber officinale TaxID=94328 RepID=A0A8J5HBE7_ZINOF|nr:hypothetical protein ZIOFF_014819 [Zingiber officinale]
MLPQSSPLRPLPRLTLFSSRRLLGHHRHPVLVVIRSEGGGGGWKLADINSGAAQERIRSWLLKARTRLAEVASPLMKPGQRGKHATDKDPGDIAVEEEIFMASELTVNRDTPDGYLSFAAAISIEQFGRMSGLTGRKMQKIFEALAPSTTRKYGRSLLEYCCFRYLSRDSSDVHPNLKGQVIGEEAFVRIAPTIAGVADISTAHHLFKALVGDEEGMSYSLWTTYLSELLKVHQARQSYENRDNVLPNEQLLCIGSSRRRPVLKWEDNIAWPGNLTLTDRALYFEAIGLTGTKKSVRLELMHHGSRVDKTKVGPLGSKFFDSAVSVTSGLNSETWILEFIDFGGEMRRDVWHASINEIISMYEFVRDYGPSDDDPLIHYVYGSHKGRRQVIRSTANSIARLQCLQFIRRLSEDPAKLVQFSYLQTVPYGEVVLQTLALSFWGGPLITKFERTNYQRVEWSRSVEDLSDVSNHVFDIDGSVYLRKWMKSPSWSDNMSVTFWRNSLVKRGIVLAKKLVVGDLSLVERAALTCKVKNRIVEKTRATIDAAMIKGIPSNIDLFKELLIPLVVVAKKFDELRQWKKPRLTLSFLFIVYTIIFRNLLSYVLPATIVTMATTMLLLKGLKEQGRLGRSFGRVVIHDQPPSNTIQKIIAVKDAMTYIENYLQNVNIVLLKIRTILLSGQPEVTSEMAMVLLGLAIILLVIPFKYILAFVIFDLFTRELDFRRKMVIKVMKFLRERWAAVHAAPVVVLPYESTDMVGVDNTDADKADRKDTGKR